MLLIEEEKKVDDVEEEEKKDNSFGLEGEWMDVDGSESDGSRLTRGNSPMARREERLNQSKSGSDSEDSDESIDLENLPEDPYDRFVMLGIDLELLETGDQ